ncbi:hypothetical protein [Paraburkholderia hospita]|uniref:hypothetical protein n=1 Tax=Paraburkholderia hospita TaxID=169430 RepID=UPI00116006F8|nr:hypothetical protein [Paraburkholderia hospita]
MRIYAAVNTDHEVGGQDLPYLVTASYEGDYQSVADFISAESSLVAFNVRPAISRRPLPAHVEFCTFESRDIIYRFFDVPRPPSPDEELALTGVSAMANVEKISVVFDLHPEDYRRFQEAANRAQMPEGEFGGLALHRGIGLLRDLRPIVMPADSKHLHATDDIKRVTISES